MRQENTETKWTLISTGIGLLTILYPEIVENKTKVPMGLNAHLTVTIKQLKEVHSNRKTIDKIELKMLTF